MIRSKVLFLGSESCCRTEMAEAFLRDMGGDRFEPIGDRDERRVLVRRAPGEIRERVIRFVQEHS